MDENNNPNGQNNFDEFDNANVQGNFGSFDSNNNQDNFDITNGLFETASDSANPYELLDNSMSYDQNNTVDNTMTYNQVNNLNSDIQPNSFDNSMQYEQPNNFDNGMQYEQTNNFDNGMQYEQTNNFDNGMQYEQLNNFDNGMQYEQPNNFDNGMQYEQTNSFDNGMQYGQPNSYDNNMGYNQVPNYDTNSQYVQNNYENNTAYSQSNDINNGMNSSYDYSDNSDYSTDFTKAWMGNIYDKAHSKKFNWCSAFFGGTYFMYRKMYVSGLLFVILTSLTFILPSLMFFGNIIKSLALCIVLCSLLPIVFMIGFGFCFYPLYRSFVNNKFNKLKATITDNSALINEANSKGGTSALGVIIALIVSTVLSSVGIGSAITSATKKLIDGFTTNDQNIIYNEITEPITDIKSFEFLDDYSIEYDSLNWFFNSIDNSLTQGHYSLAYSGQFVDNLKNSFNADVTNLTGRETLLNTLVSSLEAQAASMNLSVELGTKSFVSNDNAYYAYLDVISDTNAQRYYLILLPEKDILFQFILTSDDTNIEYATSLEVIGILTSISYENTDEPNNNIGNTITNEVPSGLISNTVSNEVAGNNSNTISRDNTINQNTTTNNQVPLQSILN